VYAEIFPTLPHEHRSIFKTDVVLCNCIIEISPEMNAVTWGVFDVPIHALNIHIIIWFVSIIYAFRSL
jgi:hypothetical protein